MKLEQQISTVKQAIGDFEFVERYGGCPSSFQSSILALGSLLEDLEARFNKTGYEAEKETQLSEDAETSLREAWAKRQAKKLGNNNA